MFVVGVGLIRWTGSGPSEEGYPFDWNRVAVLPVVSGAFVIGLLYPVTAAIAVGVCELIAFPDTKTKWDADKRAAQGAIWPLSLLFWILITPFFAIINRLFR